MPSEICTLTYRNFLFSLSILLYRSTVLREKLYVIKCFSFWKSWCFCSLCCNFFPGPISRLHFVSVLQKLFGFMPATFNSLRTQFSCPLLFLTRCFVLSVEFSTNLDVHFSWYQIDRPDGMGKIMELTKMREKNQIVRRNEKTTFLQNGDELTETSWHSQKPSRFLSFSILYEDWFNPVKWGLGRTGGVFSRKRGWAESLYSKQQAGI